VNNGDLYTLQHLIHTKQSPQEAIKKLENMEFSTCCSGRECGCQGMPTDIEYYILQHLQKMVVKNDQDS